MLVTMSQREHGDQIASGDVDDILHLIGSKVL
jgi:hypothetical protein